MSDDISRLEKELFRHLDADRFKQYGYDQEKISLVKSLMIIVSQSPELMSRWAEECEPVIEFADFNEYLFEACEWCYHNRDLIKQKGTH